VLSSDHFTKDIIEKAFFKILIASLSMLVSSSVALTMYLNKQLLQHPNKLVFYICICEAIAANASLYALISNRWVICYFDLNMLYSYTSIIAADPEEAFQLLRYSNYTVISFFQFCSLSLNFFLCLDLILTLRSPFNPHDRRMKYYKVCSVVMSVLCCLFTMDKYAGNNGKVTVVMYKNAASCLIVTAYMLFAIFSCAYSYRMTTRPGMSSEIRKDFISRHILYVLVYICVWLPYLGLSYYTLYVCQLLASKPDNISSEQLVIYAEEIKKWWGYVNSATVFTGLLMGMIRIQEPAMWNVVTSYLLCDLKALKTDVQPTQLTFLMSSLNIELVHIILTAVSSRTVGTPKHDSDFRVYQDYDFVSKN
jgi:uncharacterized membrane protein